MSLDSDQPTIDAPLRATAPATTRLMGRTLRVARGVWLGAALVAVTLNLVAIPFRRAELIGAMQNLTPAQVLVLKDLGVSGEQHAGFVLSVEMGVITVFVTLAGLVFWRRSDDWVAMLVSGALITYISWVSPTLDALSRAIPELTFLLNLVQAVGMVLGVSFFFVFPDGRLVPRWGAAVAAVWVTWGVLWLVFPDSLFNVANPFQLSLPVFVFHMTLWGLGMAAQAYRFARVATPVQRQQTKLVLFGVGVGLAGYVIFGFNRFAVPVLSEPMHASVVYDLIGVPLFLTAHVVVPVSFAVSMLRYRLWDVDVIVNRAVVYGLLTAFLAGLYTASVTFSQRLFVALTGEKSDAAIVVTTLVVASAFTPLKGRLQNVVDHYLKRPPDAAENLRAFSAQVRSLVEVLDANAVAAKALDEAVRAFSATGGAAYLRRGERFELAHASGEWNQLEGMSAWFEAGNARYGWITLGPRQGGGEYSLADRRLLADIAALVARALRLSESPLVAQGLRREAGGNG